MKKDFGQLIKEMRIVLHPIFNSFISDPTVSSDARYALSIKHLDNVDSIRDKMLAEAGYTLSEFDKLEAEYFMDFSSDDPEEWIIEHDPKNAGVIHKFDKPTKKL